jgi:L-amino acid N-acyltransferase YncA
VRIREARPSDLARTVAIYNASIPGRTATADLEPVDVEQRRAWFDDHDPVRRPLWVAEADGTVAGFLSLKDFYEGRRGYASTAEIGVYVAPEHQGTGVGGALLDHAVAAAPALGLSTLLAFVFAHNQASIALFERRGFERWGLLPAVADLDGRSTDLAILGRPVGR